MFFCLVTFLLDGGNGAQHEGSDRRAAGCEVGAECVQGQGLPSKRGAQPHLGKPWGTHHRCGCPLHGEQVSGAEKADIYLTAPPQLPHCFKPDTRLVFLKLVFKIFDKKTTWWLFQIGPNKPSGHALFLFSLYYWAETNTAICQCVMEPFYTN